MLKSKVASDTVAAVVDGGAVLVIIWRQRHLPGREHPGLQRRKRRQQRYQRPKAKRRKASSVLSKGDIGTER